MICPVVAYAPTSATKPIIAQRPFTFSAFCGYPSYETDSSMYGRVSVGNAFWRPPRSTLDRSSAASDVYKRQSHDTRSRKI